MKRLALTLGVLLAALPAIPAAAAAPSPTPSAGPSIVNFALAPGNQHPPKRFFSYAIAPGQSVADTVAVINPTNAPLTVSLNASDAVTPPQGAGVTFVDPPHAQHAIGRWLSISATTVTVPPQHLTFVPIKLSLPASVRPGQYEGAIRALNVQPVTIKSGKSVFHIRGAVRVIFLLRVTGRASVGLKIAGANVVRAGTLTALNVALQNTGTVTDQPVATVISFTKSGPHKPQTFRPSVDVIMGGNSTNVAFALNRVVAPGTYHVSIQITYRAQLSELAQDVTETSTWSGTVTVPATPRT